MDYTSYVPPASGYTVRWSEHMTANVDLKLSTTLGADQVIYGGSGASTASLNAHSTEDTGVCTWDRAFQGSGTDPGKYAALIIDIPNGYATYFNEPTVETTETITATPSHCGGGTGPYTFVPQDCALGAGVPTGRLESDWRYVANCSVTAPITGFSNSSQTVTVTGTLYPVCPAGTASAAAALAATSRAAPGAVCRVKITSPADGNVIALTDGKYVSPQPGPNERAPKHRTLAVEGVAPPSTKTVTVGGVSVRCITADGRRTCPLMPPALGR